jgi:carbonic anhydrase
MAWFSYCCSSATHQLAEYTTVQRWDEDSDENSSEISTASTMPVSTMPAEQRKGRSAKSSDRIHQKAKHFVRTAVDDAVKPMEALQALILGNERFRSGKPLREVAHDDMRKALVNHGQAPLAAIVGCADSRCPIETLFDALPGDLFVLRNAGNTCTHAEGSIAGSLEFCVGNLGTKLIVVLGHTHCGAMIGATKTYMAKQSKPLSTTSKPGDASALTGLLEGLCTVAEAAHKELAPDANLDQISAHATKKNVFHTVNFLLKFSKSIRDKVKSGEVEIHGALYHLESGFVEFLGKSPAQDEILRFIH